MSEIDDERLKALVRASRVRDYSKIDHTHCWTQTNPPCGQKIEHYKCCLCEMVNPKLLTFLQKEVEWMRKPEMVYSKNGKTAFQTLLNEEWNNCLTAVLQIINKYK